MAKLIQTWMGCSTFKNKFKSPPCFYNERRALLKL